MQNIKEFINFGITVRSDLYIQRISCTSIRVRFASYMLFMHFSEIRFYINVECTITESGERESNLLKLHQSLCTGVGGESAEEGWVEVLGWSGFCYEVF